MNNLRFARDPETTDCVRQADFAAPILREKRFGDLLLIEKAIASQYVEEERSNDPS